MRDLSPAGLELIKRFEGLSLVAYQDSAGIWTIGYGSTRNVKPSDRITLSQAQQRLQDDTAEAVAAVNSALRVLVTQTQFDVLVSLTYNIGGEAFRKSTLLQLLNGGHFDLVPSQIRRWVHAGGVVVPGLVKRREAEAALWESTLKQPQASPVPRLGLWARIKSLLGF